MKRLNKAQVVGALVAAVGVVSAGGLGWKLLSIGLRGAPEPSSLPNILFVTLDGARSDRLGVYGHTRETSPQLDRLANDGFAFTDAFTVATYSGPSHATMFTGLFPLQHGLIDNGLKLSDEVMPLAELLRHSRYRTAAFIGEEVLGTETNLNRGFDSFELHEVATHEHDEKSLANEVAGFRAARQWLETWRGGGEDVPPQPFFLWLHVQQIHQSYDPPPPYDSMFMEVPRDAEVRGIDDFELRCASDVREAFERGLLTPQMKEQVEALYDGEVRLVDDELGAIFDYLRRSGAYDDTIVVVVADHGEHFFEETEIDFGPGKFRHGRVYFDPVLRVPWILKPQAGSLLQGGTRPEVAASTVDIFPTLLDLLGLAVPSTLPGRSLLPWMEDPQRSDPSGTVFFQETPNERFLSGLRTAQWKLVRQVKDGQTTRWLIDLETDPGEATNALAMNLDTAAELERQLDEWLSRQHAVETASLADVSEKMRQALRDAGYLRTEDEAEHEQ